MRNIVIYCLLAAASLFGLFFIPFTASAMMEHIPFDEIISKADIAFLGTVLDKQSTYTTQPRMIYTEVTFSLDRILFIRDRSVARLEDEIILTFAGGKTAEVSLQVSDVPEFEIDSQYVVLAISDGKKHISPVVGGSQGLFRVVADETTSILHPLTYSNRAISGVNPAGKLIHGSRAGSGIANGKAIPKNFSRNDKLLSTVIPRPVMGTGALSSSLSTAESRRGKTKKPEKIVTLEEFFSHILEIKQNEGRQ